VAFARALADGGITSVPNFSDPFARSLLSPGWALTRTAAARAVRRMDPAGRARTIAALDVVPLRVAAIDAELESAVAAGCRQLVILGAGLDTRAFRMQSLADVSVYEVDHPATQAYKRRKSSALPVRAKALGFVPVNFESDSLRERLRDAGQRADEPTVWLWEGVVMYLSDSAMRATLADAAARSTPESTLLLHYHETCAKHPHAPIKRLLLGLWREPQIGERDPEVMHREVARAGFSVVRDTRPQEWADRFGTQRPAGQTAVITHLLVARLSAART
jgi:methyltransferase (TIGR00027 family)